MIIYTERMELIPLTIDDLNTACFDQKKVLDYYGFCETYRETTDEMRGIYRIKIQHMLDEPSSSLFSTYFWMKDKETKRFIGEVGFKGFQESFFSVEVGYGIDKTFESNGYMTEALKAMVEWAFDQKIEGLLYITATTNKTNTQSIRVLEKNGFKKYSEDEKELKWLMDKGDFYATKEK